VDGEGNINDLVALMQSGKLTVRQFCSILRLKFHLHENLFYAKLTQSDMPHALLVLHSPFQLILIYLVLYSKSNGAMISTCGTGNQEEIQ
jgi:hypothetical protein